ncbi:hypothetical protein N7513_003328 [Penicillium frequentans]|nr:hypothetical protein N7513_003328 [Penicillium glabrum]
MTFVFAALMARDFGTVVQGGVHRLTRDALLGLHFLPSSEPSNKADTLLNASPTFARSSRRKSLRSGQSNKT